MLLTKGKKAYAKARIKGMSQTESAIAAGYSVKCAKQTGYKLARDPDVLAYMDRLAALNPDIKPPKQGRKPKEVKQVVTGQKDVLLVKTENKAPEPEEKQEEPTPAPLKADIKERKTSKTLETDPLAILTEIMNDRAASEKDRIEAAKALALYTLGNPKGVQGGKKDMQREKAKEAASKFSPAPAPLKAVK